jgi:hypothetical protein
MSHRQTILLAAVALLVGTHRFAAADVGGDDDDDGADDD